MHDGGQELLDLDVAQSAAAVVRLQLCQVGIVGQVASEVFGAAEGVEVGEDGVALHLAGVLHTQVVGVGVHGLNLLRYGVGVVAQVDAVAQTLAHLGLSVGAWQAQTGGVVRQQDFGFDQCFTVDVVEAAHYLACLLQHGFLVFAHGDGGRAERGDVGCLTDGVGEETHGDAGLEVAHLDFGLHRGIALQTRDGDEVHVVECQLAKLGYLRLYEQGAAGGVEPACQVVEGDFDNVLPYFLGGVHVVGQRLGVGNEDEHLLVVSGVLKFDTAAQRAHVVADVQAPGGAVAGQDDFFFAHRYII